MSTAEKLEESDRIIADQNCDNSIVGSSPEILTKIYQQQINLAVLERSLSAEVSHYCQQLVDAKPNFNLRSVINIDNLSSRFKSVLPELPEQTAFIDDLTLLLEMYAYLFELDEVGLRLQVLDRAMCPRFHTDKLGCRLVTTYKGSGTEWLYNRDLNRNKLGAGSMGLSDELSGLYRSDSAINQVSEGDIVLLKGDGWFGNEGLGAVHRSPAVATGEKRIVATLDYA